MKKIIQVFFIFGIMLSISVICNSCNKFNNKNSSELAEANKDDDKPSICECNDLVCWATLTEQGSQKALKCASDSLDAAVGMLDKASGLVSFFNSLQIVLTEMNDKNHSTMSLLATIGKEILKTLDTINSKQCNSLRGGLLKDIWSMVEETMNLYNSSKQNNKLEIIVKILSEYENIKVITSSTENITGCLLEVEKKLKPPMNKIIKPLNKFLKLFNILDVLISCDVGLRGASLILAANTGCAVKEIDSLAKSYKTIQKQIDDTQNGPLNCDKEWNTQYTETCSVTIAIRQGIALNKIINARNTFWGPKNYDPLPPLSRKLTPDILADAYQKTSYQPEFCFISCYHRETVKSQCFYRLDLGKNLSGNIDHCRRLCYQGEGDCPNYCRAFCCGHSGWCIDRVQELYEEAQKNTNLPLKRNWISN